MLPLTHIWTHTRSSINFWGQRHCESSADWQVNVECHWLCDRKRGKKQEEKKEERHCAESNGRNSEPTQHEDNYPHFSVHPLLPLLSLLQLERAQEESARMVYVTPESITLLQFCLVRRLVLRSKQHDWSCSTVVCKYPRVCTAIKQFCQTLS